MYSIIKAESAQDNNESKDISFRTYSARMCIVVKVQKQSIYCVISSTNVKAKKESRNIRDYRPLNDKKT